LLVAGCWESVVAFCGLSTPALRLRSGQSGSRFAAPVYGTAKAVPVSKTRELTGVHRRSGCKRPGVSRTRGDDWATRPSSSRWACPRCCTGCGSAPTLKMPFVPVT